MRHGRDLGGPSVRAAFGGNLSLAWLLLNVAPHDQAVARSYFLLVAGLQTATP